MGKITIFFVLLIVSLGILTEACESDQMQHGCRIIKAQCSCGYGCSSEYRYESIEACKMALRGRRHDICSKQKPCLHNSSCLQISQEPGFKCQCEGTGFYGTRCDRPCPGPNTLRFGGPFPYECIVI